MRVCIIGGGISGLTSLRQALKLIPDGKGEVVVYEKGSEVGGLWTDPASPIYPDLKTNLPTDLMKFSDLDYPDTVNVKDSFMTRREVTDYIYKYVETYSLMPHIKLDTEVVAVVPADLDNRFTSWKVTTRMAEELSEEEFDLVINGCGLEHFPREVKPPGFEKYTGYQIHSSQFGKATDPTIVDKKILVVGAGPSAADIVLMIVKTAKEILVSSPKPGIPVSLLVTNETDKKKVREVPTITEMGEQGIKFLAIDGFQKVDAIIWCTEYNAGYRVSYPHLDELCGIQILHDGNVVYPLYKEVVNIRYPTMAVLNTSAFHAPFPQTEIQAGYFLTMNLKKKMPTEGNMWLWLKEDRTWKKNHGFQDGHYNYKANENYLISKKYLDSLTTEAGMEPWKEATWNALQYVAKVFFKYGLNTLRSVHFDTSSGRLVVTPEYDVSGVGKPLEDE